MTIKNLVLADKTQDISQNAEKIICNMIKKLRRKKLEKANINKG